MRIEYSDGDNEHPTMDELVAQIGIGLIDVASIKNANGEAYPMLLDRDADDEDSDAEDEDANAISQSQAVDSHTCESTGCCSGAPRPNFVPDHILDSASGTPGEGGNKRVRRSPKQCNEDTINEDSPDEDYESEEDSNEFSGDESDEVMNEHSGEVVSLLINFHISYS